MQNRYLFQPGDIERGVKAVIEDLLDRKWIIPNEHLRPEAITREMIDGIINAKDTRVKREEQKLYLDLMEKYDPDRSQEMINKK